MAWYGGTYWYGSTGTSTLVPRGTLGYHHTSSSTSTSTVRPAVWLVWYYGTQRGVWYPWRYHNTIPPPPAAAAGRRVPVPYHTSRYGSTTSTQGYGTSMVPVLRVVRS